jgi:hypothetical protein
MLNNGNTSAETSASIVIKKQRHEEIEQCPQCELMAWESIQIYGRAPRYLIDGVIDCPECNATVFCKKGDSAPEPGEAELLEGDRVTSETRMIHEVMLEDQRRGIKGGGGSSGGRSRKRPLKRQEIILDDGAAEWNSNDAVGIVEIKVEKLEYNSARLTLKLHEASIARLVLIGKHYDETPSMALRESLRDAFLNGDHPIGQAYGVAQPLEDFEGEPVRHEFRIPGVLKAGLERAAHFNDVTLSEAAEDMILRLYLVVQARKGS